MGMPIFGPTVMSKINAKSSAPKFLNFWFLVYAQMIEKILSQVITYLKFKIFFFLQNVFTLKKVFRSWLKKYFQFLKIPKTFDPPAPP